MYLNHIDGLSNIKLTMQLNFKLVFIVLNLNFVKIYILLIYAILRNVLLCYACYFLV